MKKKMSTEKVVESTRTKEDYRNVYNKEKVAKEYNKRMDTRGNIIWAIAEDFTFRYYIKRIIRKPIQNYLDIACGTGRILNNLRKYSKESIGLDGSKEMIDIAKKDNKESEFIVGDATDLSIEDNSQDFVTMTRLLINVPRKSRSKILSEIHRVTKKGGHASFDIHLNTFSPRGILFILGNVLLGKNWLHWSYFGVKKELDKLGFKVVSVNAVNGIILDKLLFFMPIKKVAKFDFKTGKIPFFNYFGDTLVILVKKTK